MEEFGANSALTANTTGVRTAASPHAHAGAAQTLAQMSQMTAATLHQHYMQQQGASAGYHHLAAAAAAATSQQNGQAPSPPTQGTPASQTSKPPVGSEEWLRQRRENHKEVERRRRETINDGIGELAKLVPDGEKNKGRVIMRAVQYIQELKAAESANLEKWTLEKLLCEQAIQELHVQADSFKREMKYYHEAYNKLKPEHELLKVENEQLKSEIERLRSATSVDLDGSRKRPREE
ncbi:hypothetical protein BJ742DRAFT_808361 [Cladochytrium replicatum]|nr:hypothetical protein BJ742DRAFT_808361 [Cladochytrium replicatum]